MNFSLERGRFVESLAHLHSRMKEGRGFKGMYERKKREVVQQYDEAIAQRIT